MNPIVSGLVLILLLQSSVNGQPERQGLFVLHLDNQQYGPRVSRALESTRARLQSMLGNSLDFTAEVYMAESQSRFDSLVGGSFPDWGAAAAIPVWRRIVVKSPAHFNVQKSLEELLAHEYTHLALAHRVGPRPVPRWFNEGLAMLVSAEWDWRNNVSVSMATLMGRYVPFEEIERLGRFDQSKADLAYAQSYLAVGYLYQEYGVDACALLLDSLATGASFDRGLMAATGSNYADFEQEFRLYLQDRYNLAMIVTETMYLWLALAIIVMIGAYLKRRQKRQYYKKWDEQERFGSTDFDYGDPDNPEKTDDNEPWRQ